MPEEEAAQPARNPADLGRLTISEGLAEWGEREESHLEVLETERDADDGDAADKTEDEVRRGDLPPPQQDPKHIHEYAEAASGVVYVHNLGSEWP